MKKILLVGAMLMSVSIAHAADISHTNSTVTADYNITIQGDIVDGDAAKFIAAVNDADKTKRIVIVLKSLGGSFDDGLQIAELIHQRNFVTWVPKGSVCGSICAVIWLSSPTRFATDSSLIGFHAAYNAKTGEAMGMPNAIVGSHFAKWGFSDAAIAYFTKASPDMVIFLTRESAKEYNIDYEGKLPTEGAIQLFIQAMTKDDQGQKQTASAPTPAPPPTQQMPITVMTMFNMNLRAAPTGHSANVLDYYWPNYIPYGTSFTFKDINAGCQLTANGDVWCSVNEGRNGLHGWLNAYYLSLPDGQRLQCLWSGANGCDVNTAQQR